MIRFITPELLVCTVMLFLCGSAEAFRMSSQLFRPMAMTSRSKDLNMVLPSPTGKIIVTGIGQADEDESMLSLLNQQGTWQSVILASKDVATVKKRLLSRTARYSGLLNVLEFTEKDINSKEHLEELLSGADAWIAINASRSSLPMLTDAALRAGVKRVVMTTTLQPDDVYYETNMPEFEDAIIKFKEAGASFTGVRHGEIVRGDENSPFAITNSTTPCSNSTVPRGVLGRVVAELLVIDKSANKYCGVNAAGEYADGYLNVLRSAGLNRRQEVEKMWDGGLERAVSLVVDVWEQRKKDRERKIAEKERRRMDALAERQRERTALALAIERAEERKLRGEPDEDEDDDEELEPTPTEVKEAIKARAEEILDKVYDTLATRLVTKSTPKYTFEMANKDKALELATAEWEEEQRLKQQRKLEKRAMLEVTDDVLEMQRLQYAKLLSLERRELDSEKQLSDTWIKYVYLLLESTLSRCAQEGAQFHSLDEVQQTLLLRAQANELRRQCGLAPFDVVYDPLDAAEVVTQLADSPLGLEVGLDKPADVVLEMLNSKYHDTLQSTAALRGAVQIIEDATKVLRTDLPAEPPTVDELRRAEYARRSAARRSAAAKV